MLGQISGIDAPARALERIARSMERGAHLLQRLEDERAVERALALLDRSERLADVVEEMQRSLMRIERALADRDAPNQQSRRTSSEQATSSRRSRHR